MRSRDALERASEKREIMMKKRAFASAILAGSAIAVVCASAPVAVARDVTVVKRVSAEDTLTRRVSFADLNLASSAGKRTLGLRVSGAVRYVCSPFTYVIDEMNCRSIAWGDARPQIDRAVSRAMQMASSGKSAIAPVAIVVSSRR